MSDVGVALETITGVIISVEILNLIFAEEVWPNPVRHHDDPVELDLQFDRLATAEAFELLAIAWKETGPITEADLTAAGLRRLQNVKITRRMMGRALQASAHRPGEHDATDKYVRRAERIVKAAITFGLLEQDDDNECRANLKPLRATQRLHELMVMLGIEIDAALDSPAGGE